MKYKRKRLIPAAGLLCCGIFFQFAGSALLPYSTLLGFVSALIWLVCSAAWYKKKACVRRSLDEEKQSGPVPEMAQKQVSAETAAIDLSVLGIEYRRAAWRSIEDDVDKSLISFLTLLKILVRAHTVAVFFPSVDGGYLLRKFISSTDCVNAHAVIYPGVGVIGSFIKEGLKKLTLKDIVTDSMTLYYYTRDAGIRSLIAAPLQFAGSMRGVVIADSTEKDHFTDDDYAVLATSADLIAQSAFYTYLYTEHRLEHQRIAATSTIEKSFFDNLELDAVLNKLVEIIPFAVSCDRLTISLRNEETEQAIIKRAWGQHAEHMAGTIFNIEEKTLAGILYHRNIPLSRNFSNEHYEIRFNSQEVRADDFSSFVAYPLGVDACKGTIMLESVRADAFSASQRGLLMRLVTSVSLALEKIQLLEKANTLATHDGLTGLCNHRQFQSKLKEEITRAIRYSHTLVMVLCDIDFFKKINDTYGHPFGDTILRGVAQQLKLSIRDGVDFAARYGGEEFALILTNVDKVKAIESVDRIREKIAETVFQSPTCQEVHVTMSFGLAIYGDHAKTLDVLIEKADKALYRAKKDGRNRVEMF